MQCAPLAGWRLEYHVNSAPKASRVTRRAFCRVRDIVPHSFTPGVRLSLTLLNAFPVLKVCLAMLCPPGEGVLDRADTRSTYITCNTGYVLTYNQNNTLQQFSLSCTPCLVSEAGNPTFLSNGLTPCDPSSCLYDLTVGGTVRNASTNLMGYWGSYSNTCPN